MKAELLELSKEEREQMAVNMWKSGKTEEEIAVEFDCPKQTIRRYLYDGQEYKCSENNDHTVRIIASTLRPEFAKEWEEACGRVLKGLQRNPQQMSRRSIRH